MHCEGGQHWWFLGKHLEHPKIIYSCSSCIPWLQLQWSIHPNNQVFMASFANLFCIITHKQRSCMSLQCALSTQWYSDIHLGANHNCAFVSFQRSTGNHAKILGWVSNHHYFYCRFTPTNAISILILCFFLCVHDELWVRATLVLSRQPSGAYPITILSHSPCIPSLQLQWSTHLDHDVIIASFANSFCT
jgi:hypothetical protein